MSVYPGNGGSVDAPTAPTQTSRTSAAIAAPAICGPRRRGSRIWSIWPASGRVSNAAPATTAAKAATRATPSAPAGNGSPKTNTPAAIGSAFVHSVARPAVVNAPPRWNPSCNATKASPWQASSAGMNAGWKPPETVAFVPTSPAA